MQRPSIAIAALALAVAFTAPATNAAPITGDIVNVTGRHGIGTSFPDNECKTYQNLNVAIGAGIELTAANDVGGGCNGGISVDIDGDAQTITLNNADNLAGDYRWAQITIAGIDLAAITGVSLVQNNMFTLAGTGTVIPDPIIGFTASSITILFDPPGSAVFDVTPDTGGLTVFSFTSRAVPEPGTLALLGLGLAGLAATRRRKQ